MSEEKVGNILKLNVPEFMRGMKHLDEYLDVSAEVMGDIRDDIDGLRNAKHYRKSDDGLVDVNLVELGFNVPVNIKLSVKRQLLRDLAEIHLRSGTADGMSHLLKIIGIEPTLNRGWLLNPDLVDKGKQRDITTGEVSRYKTSDRVYMDLMYGEVIDKDEGSFFEGYTYWDTSEEMRSDSIPIVGEVYDTTEPLGDDTVVATPYMIIRFDAGDIFLVDATESVDPETGQTFPYTVSERFSLLEDIIEFFLVGEYRPTTMRVIVEVKLLEITEVLEVSETFDIQVDKTNEESFTERISLVDSVVSDITAPPLQLPIGNTDTLIGIPSPLYNRWFGVELVIGDIGTENIDVIQEWDELTTTHHLDNNVGTVTMAILGDTTIDTSNLPPHQIIGIRDDGSQTGIQSGRIPSEFKGIEVRFTRFAAGRHTFTVTRRARDGI